MELLDVYFKAMNVDLQEREFLYLRKFGQFNNITKDINKFLEVKKYRISHCRTFGTVHILHNKGEVFYIHREYFYFLCSRMVHCKNQINDHCGMFLFVRG